MLDFAKLFRRDPFSHAREVVTDHVRKGEAVSATELAAADPRVVVAGDGKVDLPATLDKMRDRGVGDRDYFNFRYYAERYGAAAFRGVPSDVDVRNAARLLSIDAATPPPKGRLERLPWPAFEAEIAQRAHDSVLLGRALDELNATIAHLEGLARGVAPDRLPAPLRARAADLDARQQRVLSALARLN